MKNLSIAPQAYTRETLAQAYIWLKSQPESVKDRAKNADALVSLYLHSFRHGSAESSNSKSNKNAVEMEAPRSAQNFKNTLRDLSEGFRQFEETETSQEETNPTVQKVTHLNVASVNGNAIDPSPHNISPINPFSGNRETEMNQGYIHSSSSVGRQSPTSSPSHSPSTSVSSPPSTHQNSGQGPVHQGHVRVQTSSAASASNSGNGENHREAFPNYRAYIQEDEWAQSGTSVSLEAPFPPFPNAASELFLDSRSHEILRRVRRKMNLSSENEALRMLISLGFERLRDIVP